ncbi:MAG: hypothetical protein HN673_09290 [Rhodospirillales bacterium]|nr:hypothetical protein [Rhodospirillales bacterium]
MDDIQSEIHEVQTGEAYNDSGHPEHASTVARMTELYEAKQGVAPEDNSAPATLEDEHGNSVSSDFADNISEAMAAPASPDDYDFNDLRVQHGDDETYDIELETALRPVLHAAGMTDVEAHGFGKIYMEVQKMEPQQMEKMRESTQQVLEQRHGSYSEAMAIAERGAIAIGGMELVHWLNDTGLAHNGQVVERLIIEGNKRG